MKKPKDTIRGRLPKHTEDFIRAFFGHVKLMPSRRHFGLAAWPAMARNPWDRHGGKGCRWRFAGADPKNRFQEDPLNDRRVPGQPGKGGFPSTWQLPDISSGKPVEGEALYLLKEGKSLKNRGVPLINLAGLPGFEPGNAGIKIRNLNQYNTLKLNRYFRSLEKNQLISNA